MPQLANIPGLVLDRAHPLSRGLAHWWPMNEGSGNGLRDMVTGAVSVGVNTAASWRIGSPLGAGVLFDGSDDYLSYTMPEGKEWSASVWLRPDSWASGSPYENTIFGINNVGGDIYARMFFGWGALSANKGKLAIDTGYSGFYYDVVQTLGKWIHVAGTATVNRIVLYVNGSPVQSAAGNSNFDMGGTYNLANLTGYSRYYSGAMSHFRQYARELSAAEVAQLGRFEDRRRRRPPRCQDPP
jgi:hypothetical protein